MGRTWVEGPQTQPLDTWKRQMRNPEGPGQLGAFGYDLEFGYNYRMGCSLLHWGQGHLEVRPPGWWSNTESTLGCK